ncbi:MAG: copper chaperone PCu(A)C [Ardenticatenaceae bacterium]|nr:copper chaperone PCu(A)C [Ardenticatenaceae bacterium]
MRQLIVSTILFFLVSLSACGNLSSEPKLSIEDAWARAPAMEGGNGAVYFRVLNEGGEADRLLSVSSPVATAEMHQTVAKENGTMSMEPLDAVEVPARDEIEFKQGGMHIMLIGVADPMSIGDTIPFTLRFEHTGNLQITVEVRQ